MPLSDSQRLSNVRHELRTCFGFDGGQDFRPATRTSETLLQTATQAVTTLHRFSSARG